MTTREKIAAARALAQAAKARGDMGAYRHHEYAAQRLAGTLEHLRSGTPAIVSPLGWARFADAVRENK